MSDGAWPDADDFDVDVDDDDGIWPAEEDFDDNRTLSLSEDARLHSPPVSVSASPAALVAVFDQQGEPMVARHRMENGRPVQLEEFRRPSADEYNSIMFGGKIVRGGVVAENVPTATNLMPTMMRTPLGQAPGRDWKKLAMYGLGAVGVGAAGWYGWQWWKNRED